MSEKNLKDTENKRQLVKDEEDGESSKLFAEVKKHTKEIIDNIKKELTAEEKKKKLLNENYDEQKVTISTVIEKAIDMYNNYLSLPPEVIAILEKYEPEYGSKIKEVEEAIKLLDQQKNIAKSEDRDLWMKAREEMKMMLIGKTTFNQLIAAAEAPKESLDKPFKRNVALDLLLWYTGKPIKTLSLEEILNTIQKMWVVANYFHLIDIRKESDDQYHLIFKHRQNKRYSNYWLGYFTELFNSEDLAFKCVI
ncbi:MAG: hypothetical protein ACFFDN_38920, partial [Candidatus Hodarchaeota archaeon]